MKHRSGDRYQGKMAASGHYVGMYLGDPDIDFVKLAESQGVPGEKVERADELEAAMRRGTDATRAGSPYLIDVETARYIEADRRLLRGLHSEQKLKIRLEVDVDPPGGFETDTKPILQPVPFAVRAYSLPDLFAGKMHALLCRRWCDRVKGRDWYDFVWYVANYPRLHLSHLEKRMRQSGDYTSKDPLGPDTFREMLGQAVENLDIERARKEVLPFVLDRRSVEIWSAVFLSSLVDKVELV
jgi:hypothetical protein